ncbi:MAG: carbon-nitrogen hydrolase family protein [Firmicutes bacterium]|nr:carbon-nitrogen hydrolase family protein [Bacillota bacterium]
MVTVKPTKEESKKPEDKVRVALVHAAIAWNDKEYNLGRLLELNEKAAEAGARIIVNPELALSGYSFSGRGEIGPLAEAIPGPATEKFGALARKHGVYIAFGLPEIDKETGVIYNAAVLIDLEGKVLGRARKIAPTYKENLWSARGNLPVLVCDTAYEKLGMIICSDAFWHQPARLAALGGARLLLVLANWPPQGHPPDHFWRTRALENGFHVLACNRTGTDKSMDCTQAQSFIINPEGVVEKQVSSAEDTVVYGDISLPGDRGLFPNQVSGRVAARHPNFYTDIALDPYSSHLETDKLLELPVADSFTAASLQFRPRPMRPAENREYMVSMIDKAFAVAADCRPRLRLLVFPELANTGLVTNRDEASRAAEEIPGPTVAAMKRKARERNAYIVFGMVEREQESLFNTAVLIGPEGLLGKYRKVHLSQSDLHWACAGESGFFSHDLPFARVGLLMGTDLFFPECMHALAKRGVDLVCVSSFWMERHDRYLWEARMVEMQVHLVVSNQWGGEGNLCTAGESAIYSYHRYPEKRMQVTAAEGRDDIRVLCLDPEAARQKRFLELASYDPLLRESH